MDRAREFVDSQKQEPTTHDLERRLFRTVSVSVRGLTGRCRPTNGAPRFLTCNIVSRAPAAVERVAVSAPSAAWRFLQGESPCGVRISHPLLPSVATATEEDKTEQVS